MQTQKLLSALVTMIIVVLAPLVATADTVDNPGDVTITVEADSFIQIKTRSFSFGGSEPPSTVSGVVDSDGNLILPMDQTNFQPIFLMIGSTRITIQLEAAEDGTGTINPLTGDAMATLTLRVKISADIIPPGCQIPATKITATTGTSGSLTGTPYDSEDGTASLVSNDFTVPAATGCGFLTGLINQFLGLPSSNPRDNKTKLNMSVDPILVGS